MGPCRGLDLLPGMPNDCGKLGVQLKLELGPFAGTYHRQVTYLTHRLPGQVGLPHLLVQDEDTSPTRCTREVSSCSPKSNASSIGFAAAAHRHAPGETTSMTSASSPGSWAIASSTGSRFGISTAL